MSAIETIVTMIAGIGLFFSGVKIVSNSLKNITSHKFRLVLARLTSNKFLAAFWGFISGAISQSSTNSVFILMGLVNSGLMTVRNALPIITWSNAGTTVLIFLVAINLKLGILILLGFSGIIFGFDKGSRRENVYAALFGISVLLFGFQLLKSGSQPFAELEIINNLFAYTAGAYFIPILIGAFLRLIIHSSSTIAVLVLTISHAGLIGLDQVILIIFGMGFGEAATLVLLSSGVKGTSKQLSLFKIFESTMSTIILIILSFIEFFWNVPLIKYTVEYLGANIEQQTAYTFLIAKTSSIIFLSAFYTPIYKKLLKISPPTKEEDLSKTVYINENSMNDPGTALLMLEQEQIRIFERLPNYLNEFRLEKDKQLNQDYSIIRKSNIVLLNELEIYLKRIINANLSTDISEFYITLQNRNNILKTIDDSIYHFVQTLDTNDYDDSLASLISDAVESLHVNLITALEATKTKDDFDIDILQNMTNDKGPLMEKIRKSHLNNNDGLDSDSKSVLLYVTDLYQRTIWLINNWSKTLRSNGV